MTKLAFDLVLRISSTNGQLKVANKSSIARDLKRNGVFWDLTYDKSAIL